MTWERGGGDEARGALCGHLFVQPSLLEPNVVHAPQIDNELLMGCGVTQMEHKL